MVPFGSIRGVGPFGFIRGVGPMRGGPMRGGPIWFPFGSIRGVGPMRSGPIRGVGPIMGGTIKGGPRRYEGRNFLKAMASRDQVLKCTATISLKTHSKAPPLSAQYMSAKTLLPCSHNINLT